MTEIGIRKDELDTPALWVDLDRLEKNIAYLAGFFKAAGVNWRPHPNFVLRPEIKYNSGEALVNLGLPDESTIFGIDAILTF